MIRQWLDGRQKTYDQIKLSRDGNKPTAKFTSWDDAFLRSEWKKGKPFKIEMFDDYYEKVEDKFQDWVHKDKAYDQNPAAETELASGGIHAQNGVSCAVGAVPAQRNGTRKVTS